MIARLPALGIAALALAACGDSLDLTGVYSVTYHTANDQSCTAEGAAVTDPAYIRFAKGDFFGQEFFQLSYCSDTTEASCTGSAGLFLYAEPIDSGYRARYSSASGGGSSCLLGYGESTAVQTDSGVRVEMFAYADDVTLSQSECTTDEAESRGDTMPCENFEVIEASLVE